MKKIHFIFSLTLLILISSCTVETLYVSPDGNDSNTGSKEKPFATIARARDEVRALKEKQGHDNPVTVFLRGGTYHLDEPLVFSPEDSGTEDNPVTYEAYIGEKPILSGGQEITGWKSEEGNIYTVYLPEVKAGTWYFRQLFVNGERRHRPRMPRKADGYYFLTGIPEPDNKDAIINRKAFRFRTGDIMADWTNLEDVEIHKFYGWNETRFLIGKVDEKNNLCFRSGMNSERLHHQFQWFGNRYFVENVYEGLDEPGEWYLNRKTGVLSYYPLPGENMENAKVVAPVTDQLIRFQGDAKGSERVKNISLRGLTLSHSGAAFPKHGYNSDIQSNVFVPAAIHAEGAGNIRLEGNRFSHIGTYVIEFGDACMSNHIVGNILHDIGGGGIKIGEYGDSTDLYPTSHNVISDNTIYDCGHIYTSSVGIWVGYSSSNTISHNEVHDMYGSAISVGWGWSHPKGSCNNNIVDFNHVYNIGLGEIGGGSGIYLMQDSTKMRNNLIHDLVRYVEHNNYDFQRGPDGLLVAHPSFGFQVDDNSYGMIIENNVTYNVTDACLKYMGAGHTVRNNVFAFARHYLIIRRIDQGDLVFEQNILCSDNGQIYAGRWDKMNYISDSNIYWDTSGKEMDFAEMSFGEWQKIGNDVNSMVVDPLFIDPGKGDFSLQPESPAFKFGFKPIDLSEVGPRKSVMQSFK